MRLNADGAIELEWGELFEDDGPAAGYTYKPNVEKLSDGVWARKDLVVANPGAKKAILIVGSGAQLEASLNGKPVALSGGEKMGKYGRTWSFDPAALRAGSNEFALHGTGNLDIARSDDFAIGASADYRPPNRSARSGDGGKTWDFDHLGPQGDIDGEYYVRLYLEHYRPGGTLASGVIDLGNLEGAPVPPPVAKVGAVRIDVRGETNSGGKIGLRVRSGPTYVADDKTWSAWADAAAGQAFEPAGRYLQFQIELATADPLATPKLHEIAIEASPQPAGTWTQGVRVAESRNERIVRTSVPYQYERFDHPHLRELREKEKLDDVVAGAKGEFEAVTRLAGWSATRWTKGHIGQSYPPWDALEILKLHGDGTPVGGFCLQYNVTFVQACLSLGIVARNVSIGPGATSERNKGGHEIAEVWSDEHGKWVYVDGNCGWYARDQAGGVPLSLRELRDRQIPALRGESYPPIRIVNIVKTNYDWPNLTSWPPFLELRLIPRNNYLSQKSPLPLNQGMRDWFWTGHYVWSDEKKPARILYSHLVMRPGDFDWTLNQARYVLEPTATPGEIRVHLDTVTPNFDTFLAEIDGAAAKRTPAIFLWKLHPGRNSLKVYPRNSAGRSGIASSAVLEYGL